MSVFIKVYQHENEWSYQILTILMDKNIIESSSNFIHDMW